MERSQRLVGCSDGAFLVFLDLQLGGCLPSDHSLPSQQSTSCPPSWVSH